jgi:ketosteroid isomerase-like protein
MGRRSLIESHIAEFCKAVSNKDAAGLSTFYESGARFLAPGAPLAEGRAAIQATMQGLLDAGMQALSLDTVDVIDDSNISVEVGRYTLTIQPPGQESAIDNGKYVVVWREQADGTLLIAADCFNSDAPPQ